MQAGIRFRLKGWGIFLYCFEIFCLHCFLRRLLTLIYFTTLLLSQVYEGDLVDEEKHGTGEYRYADGTVYSGEWHRGQRQGFGTLMSPSGALYEGRLRFVHVCENRRTT